MPVKAIEQSMELRYNEPLYNEDLGITNYILQPSNNKMYGKGPQYNEPPLSRTHFASLLVLRSTRVPHGTVFYALQRASTI